MLIGNDLDLINEGSEMLHDTAVFDESVTRFDGVRINRRPQQETRCDTMPDRDKRRSDDQGKNKPCALAWVRGPRRPEVEECISIVIC